MILRPPRSTLTEHSFPTRRSSDLIELLQLGRQFRDDPGWAYRSRDPWRDGGCDPGAALRSEEHTSELQSLMRISYAVFCLKKKKKNKKHKKQNTTQQYTKNKYKIHRTISTIH